MKNSKLIKLCLSFSLAAAVIILAFFYKDSKTDFEYFEKNTFAMGTVVSQKIYAEKGNTYKDAVNKLIVGLEDTISKNVPSSPLSLLNEKGTIHNTEIHDLLLSCEELKKESGGAFNIKIGKLTDLWGFDSEKSAVPDKEEIAFLLKELDSSSLSFDKGSVSLKGEAACDLGAVGKGLACDRALAFLKATGDCKGAVISVGGSIGCFGSHNKAGDKWNIAIRHPRKENDFLGIVRLNEGFVSTSGDYEKFFESEGKRYHHILNAKTGYPADSGLISVTVICNNGFLSDALSTICFILGEEKSRPILDKYEASAVFVNEKEEITTYGEVDFDEKA